MGEDTVEWSRDMVEVERLDEEAAYRILRRPPLPRNRCSCSSVARSRHAGICWSVRKR
jgi:hypothetical protein